MNSEPSSHVGAGRKVSPSWGLAIVGVVFALAAALTWRRWPDPLVDFGMQLYLPWKISTGSVLYHDVHYLTGGPLSQYYHALLFRVFGVSLLTLVVSNLLILAGLLVLMYRRFLVAADGLTAFTIALVVVLVFAFNQYSNIGNFNYMTPYCHEVWHGLVLSIVAIALLASWITYKRLASVFGAGFCAGLVFMTKPDVFVALAGGVAAAFVLFGVVKKNGGLWFKSVVVFLFGAVIPLITFALMFHHTEGWHESWRSVAFAWLPLLETPVSHNAFYLWCLGLDAPGYNARAMLVQFLVVGVMVWISAVIFRRNLAVSQNRLLAIVWVAVLVALASRFNWVECGRSLPLLSLALCGWLAMKYRSAEPFPLLWGIFGLLLLAKLGLYSRIWHYGFALAMPAAASAIYLLLWVVPGALEKYGVNRKVFRGTVWILLMVGCARLFVQSQFVLRDKPVTMGKEADAFAAAYDTRIHPESKAINSAIAWLDQNATAQATLAVLPEGIMVNYLSRRTNPTGYFVWNPAELAAFGQARMNAAFEANAPDYVMLVHRDASEYGARYFGQEEKFGLELMHWIKVNYEPVYLVGAEPLVTSQFGVQILKKK